MPDNGVFCPLPAAITHDAARAMFQQVRKEKPGLTDAAYRREAARRMDTDYDTYLAAWKKPKVQVTPDVRPVVPTPSLDAIPAAMKDAYDKGWAASSHAKVFDIDAAERRFAERHGREHLDAFNKGWTDYSVGHEKYHSLTPPKVYKPTVTPIDEVPPLDHESAQAMFKAVRQENKDWTPAMIRREAAKRMNVDYDTYLKAWKKPPVITDVRVEPKPLFRNSAPTVQKLPAKAPEWSLKSERKPLRKPKEVDITPGYKPGFYNVHVTGQKRPGFVGMRGFGKEEWVVSLQDLSHIMRFDTFEDAEHFIREFYSKGTGVLPDLQAVNPRWTAVRGTTKNCPSTSTAWELRQRGYDVMSVRMNHGASLNDIYSAWGITQDHQIGPMRKNPTFTSPLRGLTQHDWLTKYQYEQPDGARGFISVDWHRGGGHIWNWEKRDGKIYYIDAQNGKETTDVSDTFRRAKNGIDVARVDNLPAYRKQLHWMVQDAGKPQKLSGYVPGNGWRHLEEKS